MVAGERFARITTRPRYPFTPSYIEHHRSSLVERMVRWARMATTDTTPDAAAVQLEAYRRMSPAARLRAGLELTAMSRRLLAEGIRRRHPDYSAEQARL